MRRLLVLHNDVFAPSYGTPYEVVESPFPPLKRGANQHCASGAFIRNYLCSYQ